MNLIVSVLDFLYSGADDRQILWVRVHGRFMIKRLQTVSLQDSLQKKTPELSVSWDINGSRSGAQKQLKKAATLEYQ